MKIGVIDYEGGNLRSVETALRYIGADFGVYDDPESILQCDGIVFPGVGEAASSMRVLKHRGLDQAIREAVTAGTPMFGICIGCQVLLDHSEEGDTTCLGIVPGTVKLFKGGPGLKIPHMGWNSVKQNREHPIFDGVPDGASFYFVHSYYPEVADRKIEIGTCEYGERFSAIYVRDNIVASQFHPEKSGRFGLRMLDNFIKGGLK
ncbi:imidazole glycerol phosphate synthase subunit HisH [Marispirochaeta sp.]|uniref:imidazole glycerol phosphate synthase subunit HisH n=1 Tax=Marispirochaeta sp. TaxID=2038653 RepID=UPI0029C6008D|nr:imidazole glycerol phosphate synthase subunit HisH [Marispirochaeta sp.]